MGSLPLAQLMPDGTIIDAPKSLLTGTLPQQCVIISYDEPFSLLELRAALEPTDDGHHFTTMACTYMYIQSHS